MVIMRKYHLIKDFLIQWWHLASPFWRSKVRYKAGALLALAMIFNVINIYMSVRLNTWSKDFFNALEDKNGDEFLYQLGVLLVIATISLGLFANQKFLCGKAVLIWRQWLSDYYTKRWLSSKYYYQDLFFKRIDNPDQRIAEDLRIFPSLSISMLFDFIDSFGSLGAYMVILWNLSDSYKVFDIYIPGIMLWLAIGFVLIGTWSVHLIGKPLIDLERRTQHCEADYRASLLRIREKAKEIASYDGEIVENQNIQSRFTTVFSVWIKMLLKRRQLNYFHFGYSQISSVVPYLIAAPKYFSGAFQMGELMQTANAFNSVRVSLSWFIINYSTLTEWKATVDRLTQFDSILRQKDTPSPFRRELSADGSLQLENVQIQLPDGTSLSQGLSMKINKGEKVAITGLSGSGKSTLLYVLRDIWPFGSGIIKIPEGKLLFLSQVPYMPAGTIQEILSYPEEKLCSIEDCTSILHIIGLEKLIPDLKTSKNWDKELSPGEQQRLVLGRIWTQKPDWVFLDESFASIDKERQSEILNQLLKDFPSMSILSVEHHYNKKEFYDRIISWKDINP